MAQDKMQKYANILIACCLVLAGYTNGQSIVVPPSHTTGLVGANAKLSCKVTFGAIQEMRWEHNGAYIYSFVQGVEEYPHGRSKYEVKKSGSTFDLEIKILTLNDGGIYTCHGFIYTEDAVLIVLDNPVLRIEPKDPEDGESTAITCDASFGGPSKERILFDHFPKLEMHYKGKTLHAAEADDDKNSYNLHKVYNLTVRAGMNGDGITCMIQTTRPAFNKTTFSKLRVLYSVRNITYTPQLKQYEVGSNIACTAQANPTPFVEWDDIEGKKFQGKQLQITESMVGPNKWKCTARNIIRGRLHWESMIAEFAVVKERAGRRRGGHDANDSSKYWIIGLILGIVGLAVGIGAFIFMKKRKHQKLGPKTTRADGQGEISNEINISNEMMTEEQAQHMETEYEAIHDSEEDDNMKNESQDAQAELPPSKCAYAEVNKDQIYNHEVQPLLMASQDENTENESEDATEQKALVTPSTSGDKKVQEELLAFLKESTDPLKALCQRMKLKEQHLELFRDQKFLLQCIQTYAGAENSIQSRTEILNFLVSEAEYISEDKFFEWTYDFVLTLKALLDNGADSTWIPEDKSKTYKNTAQYEFFGAVQNILLEKIYLYGNIEKVIPLFLAKECNMLNEPHSTVLHALVKTDWEDLNAKVKTLPSNFFTYYNNVIAEVIQSNPSIVNMQDESGITPLQLYICDLRIQETMINPVSSGVTKLRSDKNINMTDHESKTVLQYLTQAFPMFSTNITKEGQDTFLSMVKEITSDFNTCIQDKSGHTVLHVLAEKYSKEVPIYSKDMLFQLMKLWANKLNVDVHDLDRNTFLHILAKKYPDQVRKTTSKDYLEIIKHFATLSNTNILDKEGCTVLHLIAQTYNSFNQCKDIFTDLVKALAYGADINIKNKDGDTILHILANKCEKGSHSDTKTLLQLMISLVERCKTLAQDGKGSTMLQIMMANYLAKHDQSQFGNLVKMCVKTDDTIVNIQDDQENTALHILAAKFPNEVSTQNSESFLEMIRVLASDKTRDIKDKEGYTALQVVANKCRKDMPEFCKKLFPTLIEILKSQSNINFQDENESTVLHTIAKRVFSDPSLGNHILPILPNITLENVTMVDKNSVTPLSWILKGKDVYKEDRGVQAIFIKIEQVFVINGADFDVSYTGWSKNEIPF